MKRRASRHSEIINEERSWAQKTTDTMNHPIFYAMTSVMNQDKTKATT